MHTHPGVCVSFFPPAPALEPARPTDDVRPMFGLVCRNSRRRLAISAATSRFIPCLSGATHALLRIPRPHASLFIIHHRGPQCNEKAAPGVIFLLKLVFCAAKARRERAKSVRAAAGDGAGHTARLPARRIAAKNAPGSAGGVFPARFCYFSTACMTSAAISPAVSPSRRERDMTMRRPLSSS